MQNEVKVGSDYRSLSYYAAVLIALALFLSAKIAVEKRALSVNAKAPSLDLDQVVVGKSKPAVLGFNQWVTGLIWIHLLQNAVTEPVPPGKVSWEYTRLLTMVRLDPKFESAYHFGASFLSIFRRDKLGAKDILERWVALRPRYWKTHFKLGFHLYSELNDYETAAQRVLAAASLESSPPWLTSLGVRLLSETGSLAHSINLAAELYSTVTAPEAKQRLLMRVSALRYALEKQEWDNRIKTFTADHQRLPSSLSEVGPQRSLANFFENHDTLDPELARVLAEPLEFRYDSLTKKVRLTDPKKEKLLNSVGIHRPHS